MKIAAICAAMLALAGIAGAMPQGPEVAVIRDDSIAPVGAVYRTDFALDNGIEVLEEGSPGVNGTTNVVGSYSFQAPDGQVYTVTYVADENGVRATGDHLPVDHPKPAHALAQIAAAENQ